MVDHINTSLSECGPTDYPAPEPCYTYVTINLNNVFIGIKWYRYIHTYILRLLNSCGFFFYRINLISHPIDRHCEGVGLGGGGLHIGRGTRIRGREHINRAGGPVRGEASAGACR